MIRGTINAGTIDPLSELQGPALLPRTVIASSGGQILADSKDLECIHQFMKSLGEVKSPGKLLSEAKTIVNEGSDLLESDLLSVVGVANAGAVKLKEKPQERRPGLCLARKRVPFSMKGEVRQPAVGEVKIKIDQLQDPDEFFDAYDRMENAKKEIQKQVGGDLDVLCQQRPSLARRHRPGLLGKSYSSKHRYSSYFAQSEVVAPSPEGGDQVNPNSTKDDPPENLGTSDSILAMDLEDAAVAGHRTENDVDSILDELLSCNDEDLDGALNHLQETLNIKPLNIEGLAIPEYNSFGKNNTSSVEDQMPESDKVSASIDKVLTTMRGVSPLGSKLLSQKRIPISTAHALRSPFSSIPSLLKRYQKHDPQKDPFTPSNVDLLSSQGDLSVQPTDKLNKQDLVPGNSILTDFGKHAESGTPEHVILTLDDEIAEAGCSASGQVDGKTGPQIEIYCDEPNEELDTDTEVPKGADTSSKRASLIDNENVSLVNDAIDGKCRENHVGSRIQVRQGKPRTSERARELKPTTKPHPLGESLAGGTVDQNASVSPQADQMDGTSMENHVDSGKQVPKRKLGSSKIATGVKHTTKARRLAGEIDNLNPGVLEDDDAVNATSQETHVATDNQVHQEKLQTSKKAVGIERIKKAHPMRKSLAERGTSFENGVRRSKRIRTRPLEYWRGERLVYGRVDDSLKLIGIRCLSPTNGNNILKVKPCIPSESAEIKELLDWAAQC